MSAVPKVPGELVNKGRQLRVRCPFCGGYHLHGAGDPADLEQYPLYGGRVSHCHHGGYEIVPAGGAPR